MALVPGNSLVECLHGRGSCAADVIDAAGCHKYTGPIPYAYADCYTAAHPKSSRPDGYPVSCTDGWPNANAFPSNRAEPSTWHHLEQQLLQQPASGTAHR